MNREMLKDILPHREPMLLLDEAGIAEENLARGSYKVQGNEWFLQGHYPGEPIVPGVVQCEMLAQTCCVLIAEEVRGHTPLFGGLDKVRFKGKVLPGDTLVTECSITRVRKPFFFASGKGYVDGKLVVSADLSFAVTD